jgi:hypothetical protein
MEKEFEQEWEHSKQISKFGDSQIAIGIAKNPKNRLWQTWVSLYGNDVTCLTAHLRREKAEKVIDDFGREYSEGRLLDPDAVSRYISKMPTDVSPTPFPQSVLNVLEKEIRDLLEKEERG